MFCTKLKGRWEINHSKSYTGHARSESCVQQPNFILAHVTTPKISCGLQGRILEKYYVTVMHTQVTARWHSVINSYGKYIWNQRRGNLFRTGYRVWSWLDYRTCIFSLGGSGHALFVVLFELGRKGKIILSVQPGNTLWMSINVCRVITSKIKDVTFPENYLLRMYSFVRLFCFWLLQNLKFKTHFLKVICFECSFSLDCSVSERNFNACSFIFWWSNSEKFLIRWYFKLLWALYFESISKKEI